MKTKQQLIKSLEQAKKDLEEFVIQENKPKLGNYYIGFFDNLDQLRQVWQICKDAGLKMVRDDFTYEDIEDYDGGRWLYASYAGLFVASLSNAPTFTNTSIGFRCVGGDSSSPYQMMSVELFIKKYGK